MFESAVCEWCEAWNNEVGIIYAKTDEGRRLPLRRIQFHDRRPEDLETVSGIRFTPTFVVFHQGEEIGRITGYPGEAHFWGLLRQLVERVPETAVQQRR